jgi:hypothetical protein
VTDHDRFDRPIARAARPHGQEPTSACLDAESLAAWTDGTLRPDERAAAEAHVADCGRCLQLLAVMARTEPRPTVGARSSWFSVRWLVPLTTAAVAITAWVIIRDPAMLPPPALQEMTSPTAPPPSNAAAPPSELTKQVVPEARAERDRRQDTRERKTEAVPPALADSAASKRATDSLARDAAAKPQEVAPAQPPPAAAAPSFRSEAARGNVAQLQAQAATGQPVIASPDPAIQWRLAGRAIEQTRDGGKTWHQQLTASAELVAGTSPAPATCWIVGRSGLVLLSIDGQTWRTVTAPDGSPDLVAVSATDARSAAVTTMDGRTYRTVDGGNSWTLQEIPLTPF